MGEKIHKTVTVKFDTIEKQLISSVCIVNPRTGEFAWCDALWDTGCVVSAISGKLADRLMLEECACGVLSSMTGDAETRILRAGIVLSSTLCIAPINCVTFDRGQGFDAIIGMDIISRGDFSITNAGGETVLSLRIPPGEEHIDFSVDSKPPKKKRFRNFWTKA